MLALKGVKFKHARNRSGEHTNYLRPPFSLTLFRIPPYALLSANGVATPLVVPYGYPVTIFTKWRHNE